jgi:4-diphosphocytidyl-2-C-methyl-D-erythritol kinase
MSNLSLDARAKINITLDVLGKRPDGYHELIMVMQTVGLCDSIELETGVGDDIIRVFVDLPYLPSDHRNIAYKAAELFFRKTGIKNDGVNITLQKKIPVAAGLAGGSSDAASVLKGLNQLYGAGLSLKDLMEIGKEIGSDVPYCTLGGTALSTGRGEIVKPLLPMPECSVVLVKPPFSLSTAKVYQSVACEKIKIHPDTEGVIKAIAEKNLSGVARRMYNVLECFVDSRVITDIKTNLIQMGADGAVMSGSGPTVFGLFSGKSLAETAYKKMHKIYKDVFLTEIT